MIISTRGRYALRVMIDLAEHQNETYIPMKDVAKRQHISLKYIEKIMPVLTKNQIVEGVHGKGGGYRLSKQLSEYRIGDILRLTEGSLAPVACLEGNVNTCDRNSSCATLMVWQKLYEAINGVVDSITLEDLVEYEKQAVGDYMI